MVYRVVLGPPRELSTLSLRKDHVPQRIFQPLKQIAIF